MAWSFVCNLLILDHISHCWGQIGISCLALGRPNWEEVPKWNLAGQFRTGAQWVSSRAVLDYVCPKRPNMGQIGPGDIGADLAFGANLALFIFKNSPLFALCCAQTFLPPNMPMMISGLRVPLLILSDSAYALSEWLMKSYTDCGNLTPDESSFNIKHSTTREVVENAFGWLKVRFRSISKRQDLNVENSCDVIVASCVLHDHCENLHEFLDDQWLNGVNIHVRVFPGDPNHRQNINAIAIRDAIKSFF